MSLPAEADPLPTSPFQGRYSDVPKQFAAFETDIEGGRERVEAAFPAAEAKRLLLAQKAVIGAIPADMADCCSSLGAA